eukprot:COSAG05_NODE_740_length_7614_cov_34.093812_6_plen_46_part_00
MGRDLREVAADVVCTLGMEDDEGKIDALAVSLASWGLTRRDPTES